MLQNSFLASAPDPAGVAYSTPPDLLAALKEPTCKGKDRSKKKGQKERRR